MLDARRGGRDKADLIASLVIPWRDEGDRGEALRYSLRSLAAHLPHGDVYVVGDELPQWAQGVKNLVTERHPTSKLEDGQANVLEGLRHAGQWAYIVHDDMVVLQPVDYIQPPHRGYLSELARGGGEYGRRARAVAQWLAQHGHTHPLNFNVHIPFLVHAPRYLECADQARELPAGYRASIYGNVVGLRARRVIDPKVIAVGARPHPSWPVVSMTDKAFDRGYVGKVVKRLFRTPGPYEIG